LFLSGLEGGELMGWFVDNVGVLLNGFVMGLLLFMMVVGLMIIFGLFDVLNLVYGVFFFIGVYIGYCIVGEVMVIWGSFVLVFVVVVVFGVVMGVVFMFMIVLLVVCGYMD